MLIIGTTTINFTTDRGSFSCPTCATKTDFRRRSTRQFLTIYFIPLIPLERVGEFVECEQCKGTFRPEVLEMSPQQLQAAADAAFIENTYRIMVLMMIADGTVDEEEVETVRSLASGLMGEKPSTDEIVEQAQAAAQALDHGYDAVRYARDASKQWSPEQRAEVIRLAFLVASASGELMPPQNNQLQRLRFALKIDEGQFRQIIANAAEESV